jgi:hypothetical protein
MAERMRGDSVEWGRDPQDEEVIYLSIQEQ